MEEDTLRFWIIPIICLVAVMGLFVIILSYQFNTAMPNAAIELEEMRKMSCDEIKAKDALNRYWSKDNSKYGKDKVGGCVAAELAITNAEKEKLDKLLADPNSLESLTRDLKKFQDLYDSHKELYDYHLSETKMLNQNVTDFENKINEINSKLLNEYGVK
ncbi:hypothetical protein [Nitrosarchaeum sp. AC2]|uniref:hypothetical protein n=1 Tax=Nitrosarchaeum sp. AC2 TaxID=2259673 RepID=UPI0015CD27FB|nr:hypothetical protein [Nitrosarchaeum sp. AC2]QLH10837.1 hypothetical protein DSQ20_04645 [Nitrosarchaeum sp. AC2]